MTIDQAIVTLREFRMLRLGPELSEAIDVVVANYGMRDPPVDHAKFPGLNWGQKHNMAGAA